MLESSVWFGETVSAATAATAAPTSPAIRLQADNGMYLAKCDSQCGYSAAKNPHAVLMNATTTDDDKSSWYQVTVLPNPFLTDATADVAAVAASMLSGAVGANPTASVAGQDQGQGDFANL